MKRIGLLLSALLIGACGRPFDNNDGAERSSTTDLTAISIADAVAFYQQHEGVLGRSMEALERGAPQGSVEADLRRQLAVVAVSFHPADAGVSDFGYITLSSGAPTNPEESVALMYFADYDRSMLPYWTGQVFDTCGPEALDAVAHPKRNISEVYCRMNDEWLALETFTPSP